VAAGRPLPPSAVVSDGRWVTVRPTRSSPGGVVLVVDPLRPARSGSPDRRALGLPFFEMEVVPR
jgi:hypothetical protein